MPNTHNSLIQKAAQSTWRLPRLIWHTVLTQFLSTHIKTAEHSAASGRLVTKPSCAYTMSYLRVTLCPAKQQWRRTKHIPKVLIEQVTLSAFLFFVESIFISASFKFRSKCWSKHKLVLTCDTDSSSTFLWNLFLSQLVLTCAALHTEVTPYVATCVYFMVTVRLAAGSEGVLELLTWRSFT